MNYEEQDNELMLFDRINVIKDTITKYGEDKFYLSFSGGKDSTILHYLLDLALPNNRIPRVFINTGIEYQEMVKFVKNLASEDDRFEIIKPTLPIKKTLEKYGYPFKSKQHSERVYQFNKGLNAAYLKGYINGYDKNGKPSKFVCPKSLVYQFSERGKYNYSHLCCKKMKKEPAQKWAKENKKPIVITGMRNDEGGNRARLGCIITDPKGKVLKFHPLIKVNEAWEDWFVDRMSESLHKEILCCLYYPPYEFQRTGCVGCPFTLQLAEQLEILARFMPEERARCEMIWKPVYDEYRRIGYRINKVEQIKLL